MKDKITSDYLEEIIINDIKKAIKEAFEDYNNYKNNIDNSYLTYDKYIKPNYFRGN